MKVLLLHEFSGVHTELKAGLREIGIEAVTANFGDQFRKFPSDVQIGNTDPSSWGSIRRALRQVSLLGEFRQFPIIQTIATNMFNPIVSWLMEAVLLRNREQAFVYVSASGDVPYLSHARELPYFPAMDWTITPRQKWREARLFEAMDELVAAAWDYVYCLRQSGYAPSFIPLPVMTRNVEFREVGRKAKLKVFHPRNRPAGDDTKGTSLITQAFEILKKRFGDDVDFISVGNLPYREYLELSSSCDVVVDQARTMTYGMSAAYALAQGKVVLSGNEPVSHELDMYRECPVINIRPDVDQIVQELEKLLSSSRQSLEGLGARSRAFAERHHDAVRVAEKYASVYRRARETRSARGPGGARK